MSAKGSQFWIRKGHSQSDPLGEMDHRFPQMVVVVDDDSRVRSSDRSQSCEESLDILEVPEQT